MHYHLINDGILSNLTKREIELYFYLCEWSTIKNGELFLSIHANERRELSCILDTNERYVSKGLKVLCDLGVLSMRTRGSYVINPSLFWKSDSSREDAIIYFIDKDPDEIPAIHRLEKVVKEYRESLNLRIKNLNSNRVTNLERL